MSMSYEIKIVVWYYYNAYLVELQEMLVLEVIMLYEYDINLISMRQKQK